MKFVISSFWKKKIGKIQIDIVNKASIFLIIKLRDIYDHIVSCDLTNQG